MVKIIILGRNSQLTVKMLARVVRKDQDGLAIQFFTPLEWWPIFTYFSSHKLHDDRSLADNGTSLQFNSRREPAAFQGDLSVITIENRCNLWAMQRKKLSKNRSKIFSLKFFRGKRALLAFWLKKSRTTTASSLKIELITWFLKVLYVSIIFHEPL